MRIPGRADGGETAKLDQGKAEAKVQLGGCVQFALVYENAEGQLGMVGASTGDFLLTATMVLSEKFAEGYLGLDDDDAHGGAG